MRPDGPGFPFLEQRRDEALTPRVVPTNSLLFRLRREADAWRAHDAGLMHRGLQIVAAEPRAGLRHVGYIQKDQDVIRVFGAAEDPPIRDACRKAALLVFIVTLPPRGVVLDLVVDSQVFG